MGSNPCLPEAFFYLVSPTNALLPPERWSIYTNSQIFQLFWAPFTRLSVLVPPQDTYLAKVKNESCYNFYRR